MTFVGYIESLTEESLKQDMPVEYWNFKVMRVMSGKIAVYWRDTCINQYDTVEEAKIAIVAINRFYNIEFNRVRM